jgi:hydroxyacylglutathione hydrolase
VLKVERFINHPVPSNTYVLYDETNGNECIIVDPGSKDSSDLLTFLDNSDLLPKYIILTHEHFDHVWGTNAIRDKYGSKIACSKVCAEKIGKPLNYFNLLYFNDDEMFQINDVDIIIDNFDYQMLWNGFTINFLDTPGHSSSSMCLFLDGIFFSGDTLVKGEKPMIKKRYEGSHTEFKKSINLIFNKFNPDLLVYSGHGDKFKLADVKDQYKSYLMG